SCVIGRVTSRRRLADPNHLESLRRFPISSPQIMPPKRNLLAVILGGGAGSRLFPLTRDRSKPAVPLGGKYRLVDVPISNCINSDVIRMFVLTQYNSASLNRHIATTYRFSPFA